MKNLSPIMKVHLGLMVVLLLFSFVGALVMFIGAGFNLDAYPAGTGTLVRLYGLVNLINALALGCGIVYLANGYAKRVAVYYKFFLLLVLVSSLLHIYLPGCASNIGSGRALFPLCQVIMALKVAVLALLVFAPDLGEQRTRILFFILVALDILYVLCVGDTDAFRAYRVISIMSKVAFDMTILLAILGKYADKDRRGTK